MQERRKSHNLPVAMELRLSSTNTSNWFYLTHWGWVTHTCVDKLTIIGSDNGLSPGRRQAITWTNVGILLIGPSGTNVSEILSRIQTFSLKKMHLKMSSAKWRPCCLGLNVLSGSPLVQAIACYLMAQVITSAMILGLRTANERRRYKVTPSLIGWAQT